MKLNRLLLLSTLISLSFSANALKNDTQQPINIESDKQSLDIEHNRVMFNDNVVITQGSILIKADKVIIIRPSENSTNQKKNNQKETVEAFGKPVVFSQLLDNGKPVEGRANKVHYNLGTEFLTLTGNAQLKQADSKISANVITYDVKKQQLKATSNGKSRVKTVLIPSQLNNHNKK
ncbi:lipopolysaccharide transport periplasmic protein LptA [Seminibacterium arietis]|uniref:Lipopolysaccharide export system protein LptA n=1 Tax=Seminibacterium arietis TaxID=1173502 RepID=A0ABW3I7N6_9PAST